MKDPTIGMRLFLEVLEHQSISQAARNLDMPRATLSRRIRELEASLGVQLLHRSTRRLTPTAAGVEFGHRAARIVREAQEAVSAVRRQDGVPRGLLRVSLPPYFQAVGALNRLFLDFLESHTEVQLEAVSSPELVDLLTPTFDLVIRVGGKTQLGPRYHKFGQTELFPVASPDYLRRKGTPRNAGDLHEHSTLVTLSGQASQAQPWPLRRGGQVKLEGKFRTNDLELLFAAALSGAGIALLPHVRTREALQTQRLIPVLREKIGFHRELNLIQTSEDFVQPKVQAFLRFALPRLRHAFQD